MRRQKATSSRLSSQTTLAPPSREYRFIVELLAQAPRACPQAPLGIANGPTRHEAAPFLKVLPADVGRVGALGACVLALVRYITALPGETNDRKMVDGEIWWRASHDDIGQGLGGVQRKPVGRALIKLKHTGKLLTKPAEKFYGDRAQMYRAADQPMDETGHDTDQPLDRAGQSIGRNRPVSSDTTGQAAGTEVANIPIPQELEEHSVGKKAATRGSRLDPAWVPPHDVIDQMRAECPAVDLRAEHRKFVDYWTDQTGARAIKRSWIGTWRNWIRMAAQDNRPRDRNSSSVSTADQRVAQAQALKRPPLRLEISQ